MGGAERGTGRRAGPCRRVPWRPPALSSSSPAGSGRDGYGFGVGLFVFIYTGLWEWARRRLELGLDAKGIRPN